MGLPLSTFYILRHKRGRTTRQESNNWTTVIIVSFRTTIAFSDFPFLHDNCILTGMITMKFSITKNESIFCADWKNISLFNNECRRLPHSIHAPLNVFPISFDIIPHNSSKQVFHDGISHSSSFQLSSTMERDITFVIKCVRKHWLISASLTYHVAAENDNNRTSSDVNSTRRRERS